MLLGLSYKDGQSQLRDSSAQSFLGLRSAPPHTGSPGPFPKVPKECALECQKSPRSPKGRVLDSFRTLLRLRGALFRHFWGPAPGTLSGLFSDSSGVPGPKGPGDPVWGGADRKPRLRNLSSPSESGVPGHLRAVSIHRAFTNLKRVIIL